MGDQVPGDSEFSDLEGSLIEHYIDAFKQSCPENLNEALKDAYNALDKLETLQMFQNEPKFPKYSPFHPP